jgi:hypothetical protein
MTFCNNLTVPDCLFMPSDPVKREENHSGSYWLIYYLALLPQRVFENEIYRGFIIRTPLLGNFPKKLIGLNTDRYRRRAQRHCAYSKSG